MAFSTRAGVVPSVASSAQPSTGTDGGSDARVEIRDRQGMDELIAGICATRGGFAHRHDFLAAGLQDRHLRHALRTGLLVRLRHGAYAPKVLYDALSPEQQHILLARAVVDKLGDGVVLSHQTAAIVHTGVSYGVDLSVVHVTRLDGRGGRIESGIDHHVGLVLPDDDVCMVDGLPVVVASRAVVESSSLAGVESGMVTASFALRDGLVEIAELEDRTGRHERWPGMLRVRLALRRAEPRCESVGEVRSMYFFATTGLPIPTPQVELRDEGGVFARADFAWLEHQHVGEFDGLFKYGRLNPHRGDAAGQVLVEEKRREDRIRARDFGVSRWVTSELDPKVRARTAERIRSALELSRRRRRAS